MFVVPNKCILQYLGDETVRKVITCTLVAGDTLTLPFCDINGPYINGPIDATELTENTKLEGNRTQYLLDNSPSKGFKLVRISNTTVRIKHPKGFMFSLTVGAAQYLLTQDKPFEELELLFCFSKTGQVHLTAEQDLVNLNKVQRQGHPKCLVPFDNPVEGLIYKNNNGSKATYIDTLPLEGSELPVWLRLGYRDHGFCTAYQTSELFATKERIPEATLDALHKVLPYLYARALEASRYCAFVSETTQNHVQGISGKIRISNRIQDIQQCSDVDPTVQAQLWGICSALVSPLFKTVVFEASRQEVNGVTTVKLGTSCRSFVETVPDSLLVLKYENGEPTPATVEVVKQLLSLALSCPSALPSYRIFDSPSGPTLMHVR